MKEWLKKTEIIVDRLIPYMLFLLVFIINRDLAVMCKLKIKKSKEVYCPFLDKYFKVIHHNKTKGTCNLEGNDKREIIIECHELVIKRDKLKELKKANLIEKILIGDN